MSPQKPKICIDCRYLSDRPSGIGEVVGALVEHLPGMAPDCDFLLLRHPSRHAPLSRAPNVRETTVNAAANGPTTMLHLPLAADLRGIDLFHAPANIQPGGLAMPCVTTVHDMMWLTDPKWCNPESWGHIERLFYGHGIRRALRRSAVVAAVSAATRDAIVEYAPEVRDRVFVTRSGVSPAFAPVRPCPGTLASAGVPMVRRFCLVVGQGAPYKNHEGAVRGFALAFGGQPDIDLVLVQRRGTNSRRLEQLGVQLGIGGRLHVLPTVDRDLLIQLYCTAAALLHPSLCEGFGNPVAEAMACGCPVVTSNRSAMPEVAGYAAVLVDPESTADIAAGLRRIVEDRGLAATLRERGLRRAAELDWKAFARANLAIYRRVLGLSD